MNAPKVTPEMVQAAIVGETYTVLPDGRTTICQLTLDNGFTVNGHSACVSKENFDPLKGNPPARKDAENKVWGYLGFRLADQLTLAKKGESDTFLDRVINEKKQLDEKLIRLAQALEGSQFSVETLTRDMLERQLASMRTYSQILAERIEWHTPRGILAQGCPALD